MAKFALMGGNQVTNVIVADTLEETKNLGICIEVTAENPAGIGYTYDETTGKFIAPVTEETNA